MLTLEDIRLTQGAFTLSADLTLGAGAIAAVIGPSGAGKSTLLDVVAGFAAPDQGRVLWDGVDITHNAPDARPLSILFQDNNLFPHLTVAQNVGLGLSPSLRLSRGDKDAIEAALARVGLSGLETRKPAALSGGQRSRVALARVLLRKRPLLLLDEPFAALGPALRREMLEQVRDLVRETGASLLMVSHDPSDAQLIADQVIVVDDGNVSAPIQTDVLFQNPPDALRDYL